MEIYTFRKEAGKSITQYDSKFIMSRIAVTENPVHIGCMHLDPHGVVGYHEAAVNQLLIIVGGEGWVRANEGDFWAKGEGHETTTETGMTAMVIESEELNPAQFLKNKEAFRIK